MDKYNLIFCFTSITIFFNGLAFGMNKNLAIRILMVIIAMINCYALVITVREEIAVEKKKSEFELLLKINKLIKEDKEEHEK